MKNFNYKQGIYFWSGAAVYSIINFLLNLKGVSSGKILDYDAIITGASIFGIALNSFLFIRQKKKKK